jgi:Flp pilus assembly protein CpaB
MTELAAPKVADNGSATRPRRVGRRRSLPSGRAVVGGFLVALAMVGTFTAYTASTAPPVTTYAVATRDLTPGDTIDATALQLVAIDLPDGQRRRSYDQLGPLQGLTVVEPILAGELVQEGALVPTGADPGMRIVSFAVPRARAVNGSLTAGERVDVLGTYGAGEESCTHLVVPDVLVTKVTQTGGALVAEGDLTVSIALSSPQSELAVAHAAAAGTVTLVRTTGADTATETSQVCTPSAPVEPPPSPAAGG